MVSWDLNSYQEIHRFDGDACGVNKVKFMQTGQLITLGSATGRHARQLKIWDLRMNGEQSECFALKQSRSAAAERSDRRYTCVCCHPIDEKIILGTAQGMLMSYYIQLLITCTDLVSGSIVIWDLRSGVSEEFHTHSSAGRYFWIHSSTVYT